MKVIKRILREAFKYKKTVFFLLFLMLLGATADVAAPFISQDLIDRLVNSFTKKEILPVSILLFASLGILVTTLIAHIANTWYDYRLFTFVTKLEDELRFQAYQKYLSLHALYHYETNSGQIIGRIDRGATGVYEILRDIAGKFIIQPALIVVIVIGLLFYKDPLIALLVLVPLPIFVAFIIPLAKRIYNTEKKAHDIFEEFSREEYDVASNIFTVKNFAQEHRETAKQRVIRAQARQHQYEAERYWHYSGTVQTALSTISRVAVIIVAGYFTIQGRTTVGEFVLYITLQNMAYAPMWQLAVLFAIVRKTLARAERLFQVLDETPEIVDKPNAIELPPVEREIEFQDVGFSYRKEHEVLRDISVKIPAGTMVALVGRSGSGKSTFVNLLMRSFDPQKGKIIIDGYDIRDVKQESLRHQMAIVAQDVDLFSRTIEENIAYGKPDATLQEITMAAQLAHAHEFISKLPEGYQTMVGERGVKLSGGERQRIGIARAILRDPRILIMDEATSHLDTESERMVQKATEHLTTGRTTIVIAHRLSTVLHADKILVFDKGRIVGQGKHEELLKTSEIYHKLYSLQFAD